VGGPPYAFDIPPWLYVVSSALWLLSFQLLGVYMPVNLSWVWREVCRCIYHGTASTFSRLDP
jgi:hypothetical protein